MPTFRIDRRFRALAATIICFLGVLGCEDDQAPQPVPTGVAVVGGDNQYTRKGTTLEEPVAVRVTLENGNPAVGVELRFQVIEGGGHLSKSVATSNTSGRASVLWTMGAETGTNRMRVTVADNTNLSAVATATSSEYYCTEEDPAFTQKFFPTHQLLMLTHQSGSTSGLAGLLQFSLLAPNFSTTTLETYPEGTFQNTVRDLAFAANGDLFISWNHLDDEVVKVATDGTVSHFATLESDIDVPPGAEIAMTPKGVLVGCDTRGPFYVTCRDSLYRFEDAIFSGIEDANRDLANNDALACHPGSGDVYFIYRKDRRLYRIPFDGTTAGTKVVAVTDALPIDVSDGARGMVVDGEDGSIYILVESTNTKSIVQVNAAGDQSTVFNFSTDRTGDAGIQSDLAIDRNPGGIRYLYTLDTKNNKILRYSIAFDTLTEFTSDGDPFAASDNGSGERVGLDVIAGAGP
ncbi:MAG TPA: hypothetical protein VF247_09150 [Candidatus Krumholzibacteria bacterium]